MINRIKELAGTYQKKVVEYRRYLHKHPELSFEEKLTSDFIINFLKTNDIEYRSGLGGGTGILGRVGTGDRSIALRADMDALPIEEANDIPYRSVHTGIMHACGHDVHTSSLMGVVLILKTIETELNGQVRFIFQPGEERLPGGAAKMISDGVLYQPRVLSIYGQHVHPNLPVGKIGYKEGWFMASADELFITLSGRGGHAARPQDIQDTVLATAEVIQALQAVVSRNTDPLAGSVLSIGKVNTVGGSTNIIPDQVKMEGTFRTFDDKWRYEAHKLIERKVKAVAYGFGIQAEVDIKCGYPALYNDRDFTSRTVNRMKEYVGAEHVVELPSRMTSEDFSYYSREVPACFYRLGTSSPDGTNASPVHTSSFNIDERALEIGCGLMSWLAYNELKLKK